MDDVKQVTIFEHEEFGKIRCITIDNEPWLIGRDIAEKLGYSNVSDAIKKHVDPEDKDIAKCETPGGKQRVLIINESGLYSLVMGSTLDSAKKFKHWVTSDVLPSIRKHGVYITNEKLEDFLINPDNMIKALTALKEERILRIAAEEENKKLIPKANFADAVGNSEGTILIRQLAYLLTQNGYKIGEKRLYALLREKGYLIKQRGKSYNQPTQWSMERGLFKIKETVVNSTNSSHVNVTTLVTGIGQQYFIEKFRQGKLVVVTPNKITKTIEEN